MYWVRLLHCVRFTTITVFDVRVFVSPACLGRHGPCTVRYGTVLYCMYCTARSIQPNGATPHQWQDYASSVLDQKYIACSTGDRIVKGSELARAEEMMGCQTRESNSSSFTPYMILSKDEWSARAVGFRTSLVTKSVRCVL